MVGWWRRRRANRARLDEAVIVVSLRSDPNQSTYHLHRHVGLSERRVAAALARLHADDLVAFTWGTAVGLPHRRVWRMADQQPPG